MVSPPPPQWKNSGCAPALTTTDHSPPCRAEVKNEWCYTSKPSICLHGVGKKHFCLFFFLLLLLLWLDSPICAWASSFRRGFMVTQIRHTTVGRTPLDEWSARRRDLYLTTHNTHKRQTSMPPAGLEPTIPASERPQTLGVDRAATGIG
jgi:hypothetical protein